MIHFETYVGDISGVLTQTNVSDYNYMSVANYKRRSDLYNPEFIQNVVLSS